MNATRTLHVLLAAAAGAIATALFVQHGLGYPPCSLCELARLPHVAALALGGLALWRGWKRFGLVAMSAAFLVAFAISLRHVGVEHGWLPLPEGCTVTTSARDLDGLRAALMAQTQPTCDQPGPKWAGASMAQWHLLAALALALIGAFSLARTDRRRP